jgi:protein TonB
MKTLLIILCALCANVAFSQNVRTKPVVKKQTSSNTKKTTTSSSKKKGTTNYVNKKEISKEPVLTEEEIIGEMEFKVEGGISYDKNIFDESAIMVEEQPGKVQEDKIFDVVEQQPSFPGGISAMQNWMRENLTYPAVAQENNIQGRVILSIVVEKDGSLGDVKVARSVDPSLDQAAVQLVKKMPKWNPGKQNGMPVRVKYSIPVSYKLQ